VSTIVKKLVVF